MAVKSIIAKLIATVAYLGHIPVAPGTIGSFVGCAAMLPLIGHPLLLLFSLLLVIAISFWSSMVYSSVVGEKDPSIIIIDEVAGQMLAISMVVFFYQIKKIDCFTIMALICSFAMFRAFDIAKPYPVSYFDQKVKSQASIVLDDLAAAVLAAMCTIVLLYAHKIF